MSLAVATGEIENLGVIVDEPPSDASGQTQSNHGDMDELTEQ
jgi:hypothetical protein